MPLFTLTWAEVVLIAPELSTVASDTQGAILADVALQLVNPAMGAGNAKLAGKYLAAHLATVAGRAGAGAPIISESVGPISVGYAAGIFSYEALHTTSYGIEYLRLLNTTPGLRAMAWMSEVA